MKSLLLNLLFLGLVFGQEPSLVNSNGDQIDTPEEKAAFKGNLDLENVDNTADADKPVSEAVQSELESLETSIGLKVNISDLSTTGGENKVPKADASGNIYTGPLDNRSAGSYLGSGFGSVGNIYIPDQQGICWRDPADGANIFNIRMWRGHDAVRGEAIIESAWRMAFISQGPIQFGQNDVNQTAQCLHMTSGGTNVGNPLKHSKAISQQTKRYNGGTESVGYSVLQTTSDSDTGTTGTVFRINIKDEMTATGTGPVEGFNGGGSATTAGLALGDTVFAARTTGTTVPALALTTGGITFADATTIESTDDIDDMIATQTAPRTGHVELVAGEATVEDASITGFTEIILSHKAADGTLGHLSAVKDYGVGFDIVSTSATDTSTVSYLLVEGTTSDVPAPTVSGTNAIGDTLTVTGGTGLRQWKANGSNISGETGSTYVISAAYIGQSITCEVGGVPSNATVAWHPDDEGGYFVDLRGDAGLYQTAGGSAATSHGDPVGQWQDQSGNGNHLAALDTGRRPLLDLTTRAGYPHLNFDGVDDYLYKTVTMSRPQTAFAVVEVKSENANRRYFTTSDSGTRMTMELGSSVSDVKNFGATTTGDQLPPNTRSILTARTTSTLNGIRVDSGTEVTATETTGNGTGLFTGGVFGSPADVRVFAILFYNADLDSSAQARVRAYLKAKWSTP